MRIRSIRPEFWSSEDVAAMDWDTRLVFIGLWSYVDDNGVGRDNERLIVADLFPLEDDPRETVARVSDALARLSEGGQITRYEVEGKRYLHLVKWLTHQRVDKRGKDRYPLPTCDDAIIRESVATVSGDTRESVAPGEGEKGRRGEGEKTPSPDPAPPSQADEKFELFWDVYDKKTGRKRAEDKWRAALKKPDVTADLLIGAARAYVTSQKAGGKHPEFTKDPTTWLNGEHWDDDHAPVKAASGDPDWHLRPTPRPAPIFGGFDE